MSINFTPPTFINDFKPKTSNSPDKGAAFNGEFYTVNKNNWYKAMPFRFVYTNPQQPQEVLSVNLPISPSNLQVSTRMASSVTPSLYGIIEQHSPVRLYDITIQGVTGIAPQYAGIDFTGGQKSPTGGRAAHDGSASISLGGFLPEVTNMVKQAKKIFDTVAGTNTPQDKGGIALDQTGYYAFHQLYKFFLKYKSGVSAGTILPAGSPAKKASSDFGAAIEKFGNAVEALSKNNAAPPKPAGHPLQFLNYKDGVQYDVVPVGFTMNRSASDPMMYEYTIRLIAFNLRSSSAVSKEADFEAAMKKQLGLDGLGGSVFANMSNRTGAAATALSRIGILR